MGSGSGSGVRTRDWARVDFYGMLGVAPDADGDVIARAYKGLAKQLHPDSGATLDDAERFKEVGAAYAVLADERLRRRYDEVRADATVRVAPREPAPSPGTPPPAFRAPKPRPRGRTRARAWWALLGGAAVTALGVATVAWMVVLRGRVADGLVEADAGRDITLALVALKLLVGGPVFAFLGARALRRDAGPLRAVRRS